MIDPDKQKIQWLSILRGLNILLVVMYHVELIDMATGLNHDFCAQVRFPFNPIRMPLFIFISGGLLYLSRISKCVSTRSLYKDKFQRIMIPFFFFVTVYYCIKVLFVQFTKTPTELSISYFLESFIYFPGHPSAPLWFLAVLMLFMLMYPLYRYIDDNRYLMEGFLLFSAAIYFINLNFEERWNIFFILNIHHYFVFFFFGIFVFRFRLYEYLKSISVMLLLVILYIVTYFFDIKLLCSLTGILMMCAICMQIVRIYPQLFKSFREYIFQIYLMSVPIQSFIELILWKRLFYHEDLFYVFYIISVLSGLLIPVAIAKCIERCPVKFIRLCFGLK